MQKGRLPRILIVTAGYGEGHNSAARGVRDALAGRAEVLVTDLCAEAHPASDFAYVPDPEKPSTWKLPIFNMRHVGGALAAMTSDYRGNPVEIPEGDRRAVMKKILARKAKLEQEES